MMECNHFKTMRKLIERLQCSTNQCFVRFTYLVGLLSSKSERIIINIVGCSQTPFTLKTLQNG